MPAATTDAATTPPTEGAMLAAQTEDDTAAQYAWCSGCALSDTSAVTRAEPNPDSLGFLNATDSACGHQKKYIYNIIYYIYIIYI